MAKKKKKPTKLSKKEIATLLANGLIDLIVGALLLIISELFD